VPVLFTGIADRYRPLYRQDGSLDGALAEIAGGGEAIVHVHWEEFVLRDCRTQAQADDEAARFSQRIRALAACDAPIVWTVHNELPHVIAYDRAFLAMRAALAAHASAILVHDATSVEVLASQVDLDRSRVHILHHPSYLERFEDDATLRAGLGGPCERRIQGFGWIRLQKGFNDMIAMLPADFLRSHGAHIRISGDDAEAAAVIARSSERDDVRWDVRHVPDADVPRLLRSAACVVLPYERVLTSGVALVAMSVGALLVAVDIPQMRELMPQENHRFLYPRGDGDALRRVVSDVFTLSAHERMRVVAANLAVARARHPAKIARRLAAIYDRLRAERVGANVTRQRSS
jgi:glycosyltransferase involved in cell wall biosynthesis